MKKELVLLDYHQVIPGWKDLTSESLKMVDMDTLHITATFCNTSLPL